MLVLPENFKMKTVNRYDEKGKEWLKNIEKNSNYPKFN